MPEKTLRQLLEGNRRFVENRSELDSSTSRRIEVAKKQEPFAMVLGCVDSRVPPELIFDQGLGDLLVIRSAGQVLDRAILGSLEFGALELNIPLLVVLGHKDCGAVTTAWKYFHGQKQAAANMEYLVENLALAVEIGDEAEGDVSLKIDRAVRAQIIGVVKQLNRAPAMKTRVEAGTLKIVGAWYDLDTGKVDIIEE